MTPSNSSNDPLLDVRDLAWIPPNSDENLWGNVSFQLAPGELTILTGESGSGKSSLLRSIVYLEEVAAGEVLWRGEKVGPHTIKRFRNRVVYVHQSPVSIASTVAENLDFPRKVGQAFAGDEEVMTEEEQRQLLQNFGLKEVDFSRRFDEFSVGEQQRLALVRCLTVRPEVLLLDEPTASLDDESSRRVEEFIKTDLVEKKNVSVVWVTHGVQQRERLGARILDMNQWVTGSR